MCLLCQLEKQRLQDHNTDLQSQLNSVNARVDSINNMGGGHSSQFYGGDSQINSQSVFAGAAVPLISAGICVYHYTHIYVVGVQTICWYYCHVFQQSRNAKRCRLQ